MPSQPLRREEMSISSEAMGIGAARSQWEDFCSLNT